MQTDTMAIAEGAVAEIQARFPNLSIRRNENDPVEISIVIPVQPGLKHKIWLGLQNNDELSFGVSHLQVEWFPCTDNSRVEGYIAAVTGFITGEWRIVEHFRGDRCIKAQLQKPLRDGRWKTEATHSKLWWSFFPKKSVHEVRNA